LPSDVLIVGAGSAGSVLAERLSSDPECLVTVVESGPGPSDPRVRAQITNALRLPIGTASSVVRRYTATLTDSPVRQTQIIRGSVVGGSGAVNGGYFCRALPEDFERWRLPGWAWNDVLQHYRAIETDVDFDGPLHGSDGPIQVRRVAEFDGCTASFVQSATDIGYHWVTDLNGAAPEAPLPPGVGAVPLNIDGRTRVGPGGAFLQPAMNRTNLTLLADTRVRRIRIQGGRALGVDCVGPGGSADLTADRIVLCAGAIGSAHLLMLSGIGPEEMLKPVGISVVSPLPVGTRCMDHPEWVVPVDWPATQGMPPLEAVLATPNGLEIRPYTAGFAALVHGPEHDPAELPHLGVALMQPRSRSTVRLVSTDPAVPPSIEHHYDSEPADVATLRAGADLARELAGPTTHVGKPSWWTSQHLCRTAPMGREDDPGAVVDERCQVRGVDGLWVVDGSILPRITSRGPHATIVMIGHRAAEFITG
jgi:choline dehydrogenase